MKDSRHLAQIFSENSVRFFAATPIKYAESAVRINNWQISQTIIAKAKQQTVKLLYWMGRFRGGASKYLQNYWNWYATLLNLNQLKQETEHFCNLCTSKRTLAHYFITKNL